MSVDDDRNVDAIDTAYAAEAACASAINQGAAVCIWDEAAPADHLREVYSRRVEHLIRTRAQTIGSDVVISRLPTLRLASVDDGEYHFVVFLDVETGLAVSAWGVQQALLIAPLRHSNLSLCHRPYA